jgi:hypothetical protein
VFVESELLQSNDHKVKQEIRVENIVI